MRYVTEAQRQTPIAAETDVVVIGGGFAGIAAAMAAARSGARVVLVEKQCVLGGLGTAGLVVIYLPICDGYGRQLIGGLGEELLKVCAHSGLLNRGTDGVRTDTSADVYIPKAWREAASLAERAKRRYAVAYEAAPAMLALEQAVLGESIDIWYDTVFCGCATEDQRITHVYVQNKSGRLAIKAKAFVDCSGDADLCYAAGEETVSDGGNVRSGWYFGADMASRTMRLHKNTDPRDGSLAEGRRFYRGDSGSDISQHMIDMHEYIRESSRAYNEAHGAQEIPFLIPTMPLLRMTRRIKSMHDLTLADVGVWHEGCVAMSGDWRKPALGYSIPLASLHGGRIANLLVAGRCLGADGDAWEALRVIPTCSATGEAAGVAAAELARGRCDCVQRLDANRLADMLRARGVLLDPVLLEKIEAGDSARMPE